MYNHSKSQQCFKIFYSQKTGYNWMSIKIKNWNFLKFKEDVSNFVQKELRVKEEILIDMLKEATPIDTGKAREGWTVTDEGLENDVEYISELNDGTSKQAPARFIEKTLLAHRDVTPSGIIVRNK